MIQFEKTKAVPAFLRDNYLASLAEPQELFLENRVLIGQVWQFAESAYAVVLDDTLIEFFVVPGETRRLIEIFDAAMEASGASRVLCKSFDTQLLFTALSRDATVSTVGLLFRRICDPGFLERQEVTFRVGTTVDAVAVMGFNDGFFADREEIEDYTKTGDLFLLEKSGEVIGCGIGKPVISGGSAIDIGMLVAPNHRHQGYGSHIVSFLKRHYLDNGLRPICGCGVSNVGSRRALESAGFVCEHRLLQISY